MKLLHFLVTEKTFLIALTECDSRSNNTAEKHLKKFYDKSGHSQSFQASYHFQKLYQIFHEH